MSSVKDFIIDLDDTKEPEVKKPVEKVAPKIVYNLEIENDMDFVLNRKSVRQDKSLVFLISQDLFYIKDNKTEVVTKLTKENFKRQVSTFNKDMATFNILTKTKWGTLVSTERLYEIFIHDNKRKFYRAGIYNMSEYDMKSFSGYLDRNKKLFRYILDTCGGRPCSDLFQAVFYLNDKFSFNNAKYFIDKLVEIQSPMIRSNGYITEMLGILNEENYRFNTNSFIDYIINGLYAQGVDKIDSTAYVDFRDYLSMCYQMYDGKIKEKYPKHLKTDHDKLVMKFNLWRRYKDDLAILELTEDYKNLEFAGKEYSILIPKNSAEIVDEGVQQSNCVGSYIERIAKGDTYVCFMRKTIDLESSWVTIEVNKRNEVCQVKGFANRNTYKEEDDFIKKWAKDKGLKITYKSLK